MSKRETDDERGLVKKRANDDLYKRLLPLVEADAPTPEQMARFIRDAAARAEILEIAYRLREKVLQDAGASSAARAACTAASEKAAQEKEALVRIERQLAGRAGAQKPQLQDFGIEPEEYALYVGRGNGGSLWDVLSFLVYLAIVSVIGWIGYVLTESWVAWLVFSGMAVLPPFGFLTLRGADIAARLMEPAIVRFKRSRLLKSPVAARIKLYEAIQAAYQRAQRNAENARREAEKERREAERAQQEKRWAAEEARQRAEQARLRANVNHWMSLSGTQFERELATLFRSKGFDVESTPKSGDQGIDLILRKHGKTTVVQCKAHQSPIGPAIVRELYGSMVASGADDAILACTGGFTKGVWEFVRGKPIELVSATELAAMGDSVLGDQRNRKLRTDLFGQRVP